MNKIIVFEVFGNNVLSLKHEFKHSSKFFQEWESLEKPQLVQICILESYAFRIGGNLTVNIIMEFNSSDRVVSNRVGC